MAAQWLTCSWPVDDLLRDSVEFECNTAASEVDAAQEELVKTKVREAPDRRTASDKTLCDAGL